MTRLEHLLTIFAEECNEVAQRATKALRFGLHEIQSGQGFTNGDRIWCEFYDLLGIMEMLKNEPGGLAKPPYTQEEGIAGKRNSVELYLKYSAKLGTVDGHQSPAGLPKDDDGAKP